MSECFGGNFVLNGELVPGAMFNNADVYEGDSVYEVLRMMGGVPLFFNDHMDRLANSVKQHGKQMLTSAHNLAGDILMLRKSAEIKDANLKIVFNYCDKGDKYLIYFINPLYPTSRQYKEGVATIIYNAERDNPAIKVVNHKLRSSIYHCLISENAYEAFLVDKEGYITEGSRSNIFFIRGDKVFTAPDDKVLGGITRKYILELCQSSNIEVLLKCIKADEIDKYDSVFMSGTSPMVLPVKSIGKVNFRVSNEVISTIASLYSEKVRESIKTFRLPKD